MLRFPKTAIVHAGIGRRIAPLYDVFAEFRLGETDQMALFFLYEKFVNPESYWLVLPSASFSSLLFYSLCQSGISQRVFSSPFLFSFFLFQERVH